MISRQDILPDTVRYAVVPDSDGGLLSYWSEVYPEPNVPNINNIKTKGLEYVPFFDSGALDALNDIVSARNLVPPIEFEIAIDGFGEVDRADRFVSKGSVYFDNVCDIRKFRLDYRYIMHSSEMNIFLYIDYGDFSSIIAPVQMLEQVELSRNVKYLEKMKEKLHSCSCEATSSYYMDIINMAITQ